MIYIRALFMLAFGLGLTGSAVYLAWRGVRALQRHFGIEMDEPPKAIGADDPLKKAEDIAERLYKTLERHTGERIYQDFRQQVEDLTARRLPQIVASRRKLTQYLDCKDPEALWAEVQECRHKVETCSSSDLKTVLERNLELARDNEASYKKMRVLLDKTSAQVQQVLLGLRNLEDKIVTLDLAGGGERELLGSLEGLLTDVNVLEDEYRKLDML